MSNSTGFYEDKGFIRQTFIITKDQRENIKQHAKTLGVTLQELIGVMIDDFNAGHHQASLEALRTAKLAKRGGVKALASKLKDISPEKLAEIEKILNQ